MSPKAEPPPEWPKVVHTTIQPDVPLTVTEREYTELSVQGLLTDDAKESTT